MPAVVIFTTAPTLRTAKSIAQGLVTKKLAACVSLNQGGLSFYRWKGELKRASEVFLLIKTKKENFQKVEKFIQSVHPYEVPEIIAVGVVRGSKKYLNWISGL